MPSEERDAEMLGVPVSPCETIGVHGRRFDAYQIDPKYPTHSAIRVPVAVAMVEVVEAARRYRQTASLDRTARGVAIGALCVALDNLDAVDHA